MKFSDIPLNLWKKKTEVLNEEGSIQIKKAESTINFDHKSENINIGTPATIPPSTSSFSNNKKTSILAETVKLADIDSIKAAIIQNEVSKTSARKSMSIERIQEIWTAYSAHNPSKSVQSALNLSVLELKDKTICIKVPTTVSKEMILQEKNLMEILRKEFGMNDLVIDVEVDKSQFPDSEDIKPVQLLTQKEKYLLMIEKNPSLANVVKKLGLKLDTEI